MCIMCKILIRQKAKTQGSNWFLSHKLLTEVFECLGRDASCVGLFFSVMLPLESIVVCCAIPAGIIPALGILIIFSLKKRNHPTFGDFFIIIGDEDGFVFRGGSRLVVSLF